MPITPADKDDVVSTVLIELERMFTILSVRYPSSLPKHTVLLEKIEAAFRDTLKKVDQTQTNPMPPFNAAVDGV